MMLRSSTTRGPSEGRTPRLLVALLALAAAAAWGCGGGFWQPAPGPQPGPGAQSPGPAAPTTLDIESTAHRNGAIRISRNFTPDPYNLSGTSGGSVDPSYLGRTVTGPCVGFTDAVPNHRLTLNEDFDYLRLEVAAQGATTLLLQGPTGWLCSDDGDGSNPRLEARLPAGTYRIWVGTSGSNAQLPYTLSLSEQPLQSAEEEPPYEEQPPYEEEPPYEEPASTSLDTASRAARFGPVGLSPGFRPDPVEATGALGGALDVSYLGYTPSGPCRGLTEAQPGHLLTLHADFDFLSLAAESGRDVGLVVNGPQGWLCSDGEGLPEPIVEGPFPAGTYRIWVTDQSGGRGRGDYTLSFTEAGGFDEASPGELDTVATAGRFNPIFPGSPYAPNPQSVSGTAGGSVDVSYLGYTPLGDCQGFVEATPNHVMSVQSDLPYLEVTTEGGADLNLVVQSPEGWLCVAGSGGQGPRLDGPIAAGDYRLWVAAPRPGAARPYTLTFTSEEATTPTPTPTPMPTPGSALDTTTFGARFGGLSLTPGTGATPYVLTGSAGGTVDTSGLGQTPSGPCRGVTEATPSHVLTLNGYAERLRLSVTSDQDTTLVVNGPDGWVCNDDADGLNPRIEGPMSPGTYRIWVGTYNAGIRPSYRLTIEEPRGAGSPSPGGWQLDTQASRGRYQGATVAPGFMPDPSMLQGTSGGSVDTRYVGTTADGPCVGFTEAAPSHVLTVTRPFNYLRLEVSAPGDTTMLVAGPEGWRCSDDAVAANPRLDGRFPAGTYRIWVGSYAPSDRYDYQLRVTEYSY